MLVLVIVSVLFATIHGAPDVQVAPRIINGLPAEAGQFPYIVTIQKFERHSCAGSIILPTWILTAAHCVNNIETSGVVAGTLHISGEGGQKYNAVQLIAHPGYNIRYPSIYDIALIKVDRPITFSNLVGPIKLGKVDVNENLAAVGWGVGSGTTLKYMPSLRATQDCETDQKTTICAISAHGSTCLGDSGGPLVQGNRLVGLTSYESRCYLGIPDKYTRVEAFVEWINSVTKEQLEI